MMQTFVKETLRAPHREIEVALRRALEVPRRARLLNCMTGGVSARSFESVMRGLDGSSN